MSFTGELATFRGAHKKEINTLAWHPIQETFFASGSGDGVIAFWNFDPASVQPSATGGISATGQSTNNGLMDDVSKPVAMLEGAHENIVWSLDWHPMGHVLASGSADFSTRFWARMRPCDAPQDRFVLGKAAADALGLRDVTTAMQHAASDNEDDGEDGYTGADSTSLPGLATRDSRRFH